MRRIALTYDEKMIMKSMKRKANEKITTLQRFIAEWCDITTWWIEKRDNIYESL